MQGPGGDDERHSNLAVPDTGLGREAELGPDGTSGRRGDKYRDRKEQGDVAVTETRGDTGECRKIFSKRTAH